jgi:glycosyltransferase involved in cell wall biosynthesis
VVIPTRNEGDNLSACLATLTGLFHEVVVVDSQSTDTTRRIAAEANVKVVSFAWSGGFPKKRNWMLLNYSFQTPWVLFLDADEHLTRNFYEELVTTISRGDCVGYWLNYTNYFRGKILKHGIPQRKLALLRVGSGLFERIDDPGWSDLDMEVHEHPVLDGKIGEISTPIDHFDYRGMRHFLQRHNEYSSWEAWRYLDVNKHGRDSLTARQELKYRYLERWWYPFAYLVLTYVVRRGFLDGRAGFVYAMMKFVYLLQIQEKISEARCSSMPQKSQQTVKAGRVYGHSRVIG